MKNARQNKILEIIKNNDIETQEAMMLELRKEGFEVTQATVSRDIKELKLIKISDLNNNYKYAVKDDDDYRQSAKYENIVKETVICITAANNLLVIKTFSGMAQAAAAALDAICYDDIIGSIAGDDTIIAVAETNERALEVAQTINSIVEK